MTQVFALQCVVKHLEEEASQNSAVWGEKRGPQSSLTLSTVSAARSF